MWANVSLSDAYAASAQEAKREKQKHATNVSLGHSAQVAACSAAQERGGKKNVGLGMLERFWSAAATAAATVAATGTARTSA